MRALFGRQANQHNIKYMSSFGTYLRNNLDLPDYFEPISNPIIFLSKVYTITTPN
jgi:hypothetical protein